MVKGAPCKRGRHPEKLPISQGSGTACTVGRADGRSRAKPPQLQGLKSWERQEQGGKGFSEGNGTEETTQSCILRGSARKPLAGSLRDAGWTPVDGGQRGGSG